MKTIDVIGVVADVSENEVVNLRKGSQKTRKYVTLVDESGCAISLTLWASMNEKVTSADMHKVLAVKGARVSEYGGKSLNAADDHSSLFIDLNHERNKQLTKWFASQQQAGLGSLEHYANLTVKQIRGET
jgi:replication factor A1